MHYKLLMEAKHCQKRQVKAKTDFLIIRRFIWGNSWARPIALYVDKRLIYLAFFIIGENRAGQFSDQNPPIEQFVWSMGNIRPNMVSSKWPNIHIYCAFIQPICSQNDVSILRGWLHHEIFLEDEDLAFCEVKLILRVGSYYTCLRYILSRASEAGSPKNCHKYCLMCTAEISSDFFLNVPEIWSCPGFSYHYRPLNVY